MLPTPRSDLKPNTPEFETTPLIKPTGFREYDCRWLFPQDINLLGYQAMGLGLGTYLHEVGVTPRIVVGHDYRAYSQSIKHTLVLGLMAAGCEVVDIGLALSPVAYFAQFALDCPAVAMVTASHNENGWSGIKMGARRPLTFGPDEIGRLKEIVLGAQWIARPGGSYRTESGVRERYIADLIEGKTIRRKLKAVVACGNGTAGAFAPEAIAALGIEVVPLDCGLDYTFPRYNPNPEDLEMLHAMSAAVKEHKADLGLAFDGDGDRCGFVDNEGQEIFADKIGVMLARDLTKTHPGAQFVVDVKSTGLYLTDPVLKDQGARIDYWKTGHSYIKRRSNELKALAGIEKSGHYFFNPPIGRGYDDGLVAAIAVLSMLDHNPGQSLADLYRALPKTWGSPTMGPYCADEVKYDVVSAIRTEYEIAQQRGEKILGLAIRELVTVNGVRVILEDGTWGLVRASSNKPSLVVVCESPASEMAMRGMFADIDERLKKHPQVGEYDQKI